MSREPSPTPDTRASGGIGSTLRDAWHLAVPYFRSAEGRAGWGLLAAVLALNLVGVGIDVVLNYWNGAFYDSLGSKDLGAFTALLLWYRHDESGFMPGFVSIAAAAVAVSIYRTYLTQWLQIRWRRWMTERLLADWLSDRAYYAIGLTPADGSAGEGGGGADNPDQRIAEDVRGYVDDTLRLGLGLLTSVVSLVNFSWILWTLSGSIALLGVQVPGYMLWAALLYAVVGSWLTYAVGRPLTRLEFDHQRTEADFRFALVRLRENAEGVALHGGEAEEGGVLLRRFRALMDNFYRIMRRQKLLNTLTQSYAQAAVVFPFVLAAPRYFSGAIPLGGLTRTAGAFAQVQDASSWLVNSYAEVARWQATVNRLGGFRRAIAAARAAGAEGVRVVPAPGPDLALLDATIRLPDGTPLLAGASLHVPAGRSTVVSGASGSGKSTLFRVLAGIWPFATGTVQRPAGRPLFLPQRPYLPLGTLRHAVSYPAGPAAFPDDAVRAVLLDAGLPELVDRLDEERNWAALLSGGEQQRLALARALLLRPAWLFLDEATASLDPAAEAGAYAVLRRRLPDTTIVSIAHRPAVADVHDAAVVLRRVPGGAGTLDVLAGC